MTVTNLPGHGTARLGPAEARLGAAGQPFTPSRSDGRSDRRVVFEFVQDADPGDTFTYDQLTAVLSVGLDGIVGRDRVYRAVTSANRTLLQERRRYLIVVKDVGYRVINADEHLGVALMKKEQAQTYLKRGIDLLRNVHIEELTATQRTLHEGQLLILGGLYQATKESARRHDRSEQLIADLQRRMDSLEQER